MRLILLPALDGTGLMFQAFIRELGESFETTVISYPQSGPQDYDCLAKHVREKIPEGENYLVLGESFAGPIVYRIATSDPEHCKGAIFVATYLTNPQPKLLRILSFVPSSIISFFVSRPSIVRKASLSRAAEREVAKAIANNFSTVPPAVFKDRLAVIGEELEVPTQKLNLPCLYIKATDDQLVLVDRLPDFKSLSSSFEVASVRGGHFVLQENPKNSAKVVLDNLSYLSGAAAGN